ncbi:N-acetylmuramoyl-L-alanine amidase [Oceanobacillus kimchii]|uniref:N-acetylmuramoyl-L-alanine amidase n=1 Tax=Oceanobacillus kimchii TaxID=746691 RepID=UPI000985B264|nr:N-acetylmuramoyl-L-alanine amidase [Oceanobacillus kimchii]
MNKKTSITTLFCMALMIVMFSYLVSPVITYANDTETYEVSSSTLNIRSAPSNDSRIVGQFVKGNQLTTFKEQYGWVQTYYGGKEVWVAKHHLTPVSTSSSASTSPEMKENLTVTVAAESVMIRAGAGTNYKNTHSVYQGDEFDVISSEGDWYQIKLQNGETGWIASWLTTEVGGVVSEETSSSSQENISNPPQQQPASSGSLAGYTIVIDPGHGGKDPGAIGIGDVQEKDIVYSTSNHVVNQLKEAGANVITTRSGDYFVSLEERVRISNDYQTDAFISIHFDSFPLLSVSGTTAYYAHKDDQPLAADIQSFIASSVELTNRGSMHANYKVLRDTNAPSVLVELGFISNQYDVSIVQTNDYQQRVATAITNGLIQYFK